MILPPSNICSQAYWRDVASIPAAIPVAPALVILLTKRIVAFNSTPSAATTFTSLLPRVLSANIRFTSL